MVDARTDITAILLAAGASRRFGAHNKLLAEIDGAPLVARAAASLYAAGLTDIVAVTAPSPAGDPVVAALRAFPVRLVGNPDHARGMATSIRCGAAAASAASGVMIVPADMPALDPDLLTQLIEGFRRHGGERIVVPVTPTGEQRNPVLWPASLRPELLKLDGDGGGKGLLSAYADRITQMQWNDERPFEDIDTQADLSAFRRNLAAGQPVRSKP